MRCWIQLWGMNNNYIYLFLFLIFDLFMYYFGNSWGDQCYLDIDERDRGGFCSFSVRNLVASHSLASYVIDTVRETQEEVDTSVETLLVMVERDGPTRNSLVVDYVNTYYNYDEELINSVTNDCMWFISEECQSDDYEGSIDNTCGVPHSSMSNADNLGIAPYYLWWNETYHQGLIDWINNEVTFDDNFITTTQWDGTRQQCVYLDIMDPPNVLVASVPRLTTIALQYVEEQILDNVKEQILDALAAITHVPRGVLELSYTLLSADTDASDSDGDYYEFYVTLDSVGADVMETLLDNGVTTIGNVSLAYVTVNGQDYAFEDVTSTTKTPTTTDSNSDTGIMIRSWFIVCICIIFQIFWM